MNQFDKINNRLFDYFGSKIYKNRIKTKDDINTQDNSVFINSHNYTHVGNSVSSQGGKNDKFGLIILLMLLSIFLIGFLIIFAIDDYVNYFLSGISKCFDKLDPKEQIILTSYKKWIKIYLRRAKHNFYAKLILFLSCSFFFTCLYHGYSNYLIISYISGMLSLLYLCWYYFTYNFGDEYRKYVILVNEITKKLSKLD